MSIKVVKKDIFWLETEAIVNPVNCVGVMGKGLALQFKTRFPRNFLSYKKACENNEIFIGKCHTFLENRTFIINFPTKNHWREKSSLEIIEKGLISLKEEILKNNISSIAIPALGCGLGGLKFKEVFPLIETSLNDVSENVKILIVER